MELDVSFKLAEGDLGLLLPAVNVLQQLDESLSCQSSQGQQLRHPLAVYNISANQIAKRAIRVIKCLHEVPDLNESDRSGIEDLLEAQDSLLDSLMEHMDDCRSIAVSAARLNGESRTPDTKQYDKSIKAYRDHIAHVVNAVKHSQSRLRLTAMSRGAVRVLGYYVEGLNEQGVVGPIESIHRGGHTAFSFARNLRFHVAAVAHVSFQLGRHVADRLNVADSVTFASTKESNKLTEMIESIGALPVYVFPDERVYDDWIHVSLSQKRGRASRLLRIQCPTKGGRPRWLPRGQVQAFFEGDGKSKNFRVPYMGSEFWEELPDPACKRGALRL